MNLTIFKSEQFGEVRTVLIDNEPWFVAKDVCDALELTNITETIKRVEEDDLTSVVLNSGEQNREMKVVNEAGLYDLIFISRKQEAKDFKRWITHNVLPSIRKKGNILMPQTIDYQEDSKAVCVKSNSETGTVFNGIFGDLTVIEQSGVVWFKLADVCNALELTNPSVVAGTIRNSDKAKFNLGSGGSNPTFVNESGLYKCIFSSRKAEAEKFQYWVFDTVLPSIRRYDGYLAGQEHMTKEQFMAKAIVFANEVIEDMKKELANVKEEKKEITYAYEYQKSQNRLLTHINKTYCATEIAKELGMKSANELNIWLKDKGVQYYMNKTWVPYSKYATLGYFDIKQEVLDSGKVIYHRKITQTGREFILTLFDKGE